MGRVEQMTVEGKKGRREGAVAGVVFVVLPVFAGAFLGSCGRTEVDPTREIEVSRTIENGQKFRWDASVQERFGLQMPGAAEVEDGELEEEAPIAFDLPEGWSEVTPTRLRPINLIASGGEVQCYITILVGDGGGEVDNVNRWRRQYEQPPMSPEEVESLPRIPMFGGSALIARIDGKAERMIGTMSLLNGAALFVKMTGPVDLVAAEAEAFISFCSSLQIKG